MHMGYVRAGTNLARRIRLRRTIQEECRLKGCTLLHDVMGLEGGQLTFIIIMLQKNVRVKTNGETIL